MVYSKIGEWSEIRSAVSHYNTCTTSTEHSKGGGGDGVELWLSLKPVVWCLCSLSGEEWNVWMMYMYLYSSDMTAFMKERECHKLHRISSYHRIKRVLHWVRIDFVGSWPLFGGEFSPLTKQDTGIIRIMISG